MVLYALGRGDIITAMGIKANISAAGLLEDRSLRLDHVGIAVRSIASSRSVYEAIGMLVAHEETIAQEQVKVVMLGLGDSRLELLEPLIADSPVSRFIEKRGEGLHHIALRADSVEVKFEQLQQQGIRLASASIRTGACGKLYFFIHPASAGGVLIEIVGDAASSNKLLSTHDSSKESN